MSFEQCVAGIRAAAGVELSDEQVRDILAAVERRARARRKRSPMNSAGEELRTAAAELGTEAQIAATIEKWNRLLNVVKKQERFGRYDAAEGNEAFELSAMNVGREGPAPGLARSVDAETQAIRAMLAGPLLAELRKGGLLRVFRDRVEGFDRAVARELWRLSDPDATPSGNDIAAQVAAIVGKYQEAARLMQNREGAFIRKLPGWIVRQSHDSYRIAHASATSWMERLRRGGTDADYRAWRDFILPRLDERTFDDIGDTPADRDRFLRDIWSNLVTGNHTGATGAGDWLGGFKGPGNMAKRVSQERVLHFKGADDWYDYNQRFGTATLFEAIVGGLNAAGRNVAMMRTWGTNPEAAFRADREQLIRRARDRGDFRTAEKLASYMREAEFDALLGARRIPGNPRWADVAQGIKNVQSLSKLGGVFISSWSDIASRMAALRHHGIGYLEGLWNGIEAVMRGRDEGWRREFADYMGVGIDGLLGHMYSQVNANDGARGTMAKLLDGFFRMNGLTWWTDSQKTAHGIILSRNLGRNAGVGFDALNPDLRRSLGRYGIDAGMWDEIRGKGLRRGDDGTEFIMAEGLDLETEIALRSYFVDSVNEAMNISGPRQRAILSGGVLGVKPGTPAAEVIGVLTQFKSFPLAFTMRTLGREWRRKGSPDGAGLAGLIVTTTALGYLSMTAKDLLKGRNPRDPLSPETWGAAFLQGGGGGIYGDFLFGDYNRFGGSFLATIGGPTVGSIEELARIFAGTIRAEDMGAEATRFAVNHAPFVNLFYTRIALDWLLLWHVNEFMSPGWAERFERRMYRDNNQTMWLSPTAAVGGRPPRLSAVTPAAAPTRTAERATARAPTRTAVTPERARTATAIEPPKITA